MITFKLLAKYPEHIPTVSKWLFDEFGDVSRGHSVENAAKSLRSNMSAHQIPVHIITLQDDDLAGFIALKFHEMEEYHEREHWLGSLYVSPRFRGQGIGAALIEELERQALHHKVSCINLQTVKLNGGLYAKLGWTPVETIISHNENVLVMEKFL